MDERAEVTSSQYLTFIVRDEDFAVEIYKVREVVDFTKFTRVPRMPEYLSGVINLRGNVVPIIDLGLRLGMAPIEKTVNTCIMIMEISVDGEGMPVHIGVLSDAVQEVVDLTPDKIEAVPKMGTKLNTDFIKGMGRQGEKFIILLDIDRLLSSENERKGTPGPATASEHPGPAAAAA